MDGKAVGIIRAGYLEVVMDSGTIIAVGGTLVGVIISGIMTHVLQQRVAERQRKWALEDERRKLKDGTGGTVKLSQVTLQYSTTNDPTLMTAACLPSVPNGGVTSSSNLSLPEVI